MLTEGYKNRISELAGLLTEQGRVEFLKGKFKEWSDSQYSERKKNGEKMPPKKAYDKEMSDIFENIIAADPSHNKQNSQWIIRLYTTGIMPLEDLYKATEYLTLYEKVKQRIPVEKRDILKYKNLPDLYDTIAPYVKAEVLSKSEQEKAKKLEGADRIYEDNEWLVIHPKTEPAACLYGKDTTWCTTSGHFKYYHDKGPLYILFDKRIEADARKNPMKKLQFHFETDQFMDATDRRLKDIGEFFRKNKKLLDVFVKEGKATAPFRLEHRLMPKEEVKKILFDPKKRLEFLADRQGRGTYGAKWIFDYLKEIGETGEIRNIIYNDKKFLEKLLATDKLDDVVSGFEKLGGNYKDEMADFLHNNKAILGFMAARADKTDELKKYLTLLARSGSKGQKYAKEMYVETDTIYNLMREQRQLVDYYSFLVKGFLDNGHQIALNMIAKSPKYKGDFIKDYGDKVYKVMLDFIQGTSFESPKGKKKMEEIEELSITRNSIFEEGKKYLRNIGFISD